MSLHVGFVVKSFVADGTADWRFIAVHVNVTLQLIIGVKSLEANVTFEGFVFRVASHVYFQLFCVSTDLSTYITGYGIGSNV